MFDVVFCNIIYQNLPPYTVFELKRGVIVWGWRGGEHHPDYELATYNY